MARMFREFTMSMINLSNPEIAAEKLFRASHMPESVVYHHPRALVSFEIHEEWMSRCCLTELNRARDDPCRTSHTTTQLSLVLAPHEWKISSSTTTTEQLEKCSSKNYFSSVSRHAKGRWMSLCWILCGLNSRSTMSTEFAEGNNSSLEPSTSLQGRRQIE